ncbi:hypothetical protein DPMN_140631 [Dreissena polymorpha]|uniref:Uncharacterized protein n=1 Tax=Dreissena polymorpha TaxID=45954 RepID=A0A9D4GDW1_DREPO|nr:hypothetical protein DPMN_140631 [Dreissena polymorpha]
MGESTRHNWVKPSLPSIYLFKNEDLLCLLEELQLMSDQNSWFVLQVSLHYAKELPWQR